MKKNVIVKVLAYFGVMTILFSSQTVKAKQLEQLPIESGVYATDGTECPNASIKYNMRYDIPSNCISYNIYGKLAYFSFNVDIGGDSTSQITSINKKDNVYYIKGVVLAASGRDPVLDKFKWTMTVIDTMSFSITEGGKTTKYHYCGNDYFAK